MVRILLLMMAAWMEAEPEATSCSLLYRDHVCTDAEAAWFAFPDRLAAFEEYAKFVEAFPEQVDMRIVYIDGPANDCGQMACEGVKNAINACRWQIYK